MPLFEMKEARCTLTRSNNKKKGESKVGTMATVNFDGQGNVTQTMTQLVVQNTNKTGFKKRQYTFPMALCFWVIGLLLFAVAILEMFIWDRIWMAWRLTFALLFFYFALVSD